MTEKKVLSERELEDIIKTIPASHHRLALMVHDAVLREKAKAAEDVPAAPPLGVAVRFVAQWLLDQAGDADTVRANHTRKLSQRLLDGEADEAISPCTIADATRLLVADTKSIARSAFGTVRVVSAGDPVDADTLVLDDGDRYERPRRHATG